ncbi:hypothetical protein HHI36_010929 [Cryptolaemus montrouzieri]|uniref:Uncharacterized protein n=1 Tax=Cryptolaemus montrouzieri TaxID=559131 RepID=A0ABD2MKD6_9CUCU
MREWQKSDSTTTDKPNLKELLQFLEQHCRILHKVNSSKRNNDDSIKSSIQQYYKKNHPKLFTVATRSCAMCNRPSHEIYEFSEFKNLSVPERVTKVEELRLFQVSIKWMFEQEIRTLPPLRQTS